MQMFPGHPNKKCRLASYLMEHLDFEVQLCIDVSKFKESPIICIYLSLHLRKRFDRSVGFTEFFRFVRF